ncbi:hypothetical protein [Caulobacter sp. 1776]|uniref:hypothetical protein n=1 Tax=Caulobacter sp. 1776 TaxID=3156420 RepID=UPI003393C8A2
MKTIGKFTKTVVAVAITGALVAPATAAFAGEKTDRAIVGALIGGVAGAALGHGKGDAVAIGAVAGAALGATTAKDKYDRRYSSGYRTAPRYGYDNRYSDGRYGYDNRYAYERHGHRYDRYDDRYAYGYRR